MKRKIFITGIGGCVGHYLFDLLVNNPEYEIYLLIRRPEKLKRDISKNPNIHVIKDDLVNISKYKDILSQVDYLVHLAVGWGKFKTNYDYTINLFELLNPSRCQKVIYFSTASILDENNNVIEEAGKSGTSYIRGKYLFYKKLPEFAVYDRVITLFPTWVLGGDSRHPYSHATSGLKQALNWLWLIRFFNFEVGFHFIHAQDIALIVDYLLKNDSKEKNYVLGNKFIMAEDFLARICKYFHKKIYFRIKIKPSFVKSAAALFRIKLSDWDRFCLDKGIFKHQVVSAHDFGIKSQHSTIEDVLKDVITEGS
jgi:nucleoside-diphosphate-sugar epimerase